MSLATSRRLLLMFSKLALGVSRSLSILYEFVYDGVTTLCTGQSTVGFQGGPDDFPELDVLRREEDADVDGSGWVELDVGVDVDLPFRSLLLLPLPLPKPSS